MRNTIICGIYKFTNKVNGKVYIGQSVDVYTRKASHRHNCTKVGSSAYNTYFHAALRKYGKDNFDFEIIEECPEHLLNEREMYWIDYYKSYKSEIGYNMNLGGSDRTCFKKSVYQIDTKTKEIVKEHDSLASAARDVNGYVGALSLVCSGKLTSAYNYIWCFKDEYDEEKYSNYKRKKQCKEIYQIDIKTKKVIKEYESMIEAAKEVGGVPSVITQVCTYKRKTYKGFIWCYVSEYYDGKYDDYVLDEQVKGVYQIDIKTNEIINEYNTLSEALIGCGGKSKTNISFACKGITKSAYGYKWRYKNE